MTSVARLGVAGLNIEDADLPPENLVARIKASRAALKREGLDIFINARWPWRLEPQHHAA